MPTGNNLFPVNLGLSGYSPEADVVDNCCLFIISCSLYRSFHFLVAIKQKAGRVGFFLFIKLFIVGQFHIYRKIVKLL